MQPFLFQDVFNNQFTHENCAGEALSAYDGSLDAAKSLHEAVLPGWRISFGQNVWSGKWFATMMTVNGRNIEGLDFSGESPDNPARAWLLAILRALHSQSDSAATTPAAQSTIP